ncbi:hypothetical protein CXB49_00230 [Chromobacterium sp. ATCC 53434]|nr:hypothetical protein CXB49_00230 [Chromobacterium sp. ATCC 53434]
MVDQKNQVWISDYQNGVLYRIDGSQTTLPPEATIIYSELNAQFVDIALQADSKGQRVWVLDSDKATLYAFELEAKATSNPAKKIILRSNSTADHVAYDVDTNTLWVTVRDNQDDKYSLCSINVAEDMPTPHFYDVEAGIVAPKMIKSGGKGGRLYLGTGTGKVVCYDISGGAAKQPSKVWETPVLKNGSDAISVEYLEVDAAGYIWFGDSSNETHPGVIYGLEPERGELQAQFNLKNVTSTVQPMGLAWDPASDYLLVSDDNPNGGLVWVSLKDAGPIDKDGKAKYTLAFEPLEGSAVAKAVFGPITLKATFEAKPLAVPVMLSIDDKSLAKLTSTPASTSVPTGGLVIKDLTAEDQAGKTFVLTASGRGNLQGKFKGMIDFNIKQLDFSPNKKRYAQQGDDFPIDADTPVLKSDPADLKAQVKLKVTGGIFPTVSKDESDMKIGEKIPAVKAGKKAGDLVITATAQNGKQAVLTWKVLATPTETQGRAAITFNRHSIPTQAKDYPYHLMGHEDSTNPSSKLIGVGPWSVRVTIDPAVSGVKFKAGASVKMDSAGQWIELMSAEDTGLVNIPYEKLEISTAVSHLRLTIRANTKREGGGVDSLAPLDVPIKIQ